METISQQISVLESRQLRLQAIMASSDAHASKCIKLGRSFQEEYPSEYTEYVAAREEFNRNEVALASLQDELTIEEAASDEA